jgi:hypothetical protein
VAAFEALEFFLVDVKVQKFQTSTAVKPDSHPVVVENSLLGLSENPSTHSNFSFHPSLPPIDTTPPFV